MLLDNQKQETYIVIYDLFKDHNEIAYQEPKKSVFRPHVLNSVNEVLLNCDNFAFQGTFDSMEIHRFKNKCHWCLVRYPVKYPKMPITVPITVVWLKTLIMLWLDVITWGSMEWGHILKMCELKVLVSNIVWLKKKSGSKFSLTIPLQPCSRGEGF